MKAFRSASVPVSVMAVAVPPMTMPEPLLADSAPAGTDRVTVSWPAPASTSLNEMPVMAPAMSSVRLMPDGTVMTGASLTAATRRVTVPLAVSAPSVPVLPLSLIVTLSVMSPLALGAARKLTSRRR